MMESHTIFQSHLLLIHPIHTKKLLISLLLSCFNRICSSYTLSTSWTLSYDVASAPFQSHLRLIHPIHMISKVRSLGLVMFQSHLRLFHPIHNPHGRSRMYKSELVSTASAPHTPYPLWYPLPHSCTSASFNRICSSYTLSTLVSSTSFMYVC